MKWPPWAMGRHVISRMKSKLKIKSNFLKQNAVIMFGNRIFLIRFVSAVYRIVHPSARVGCLGGF